MPEMIYRKLNELKKLPNNPRTITRDDLETLKTSIKNNPEYFEARPIILSNRTGELIIIAGNQRYEAAKSLGLTEVPTFLLENLTEEKERELIIRDNVENGEWDMDLLANEWDEELLKDWGVDINWDAGIDETVEKASEGSVADYNDDVNYDLTNLYRERLNSDISKKLDKYISSGKIRPEIADVLKTRALQCSVFNFDELIKFYRSDDASEEEKEMLERLYLVFITPKEAIEKGMLEIEKTTGEIYDRTLMEKTNEQAD